jgi:ABC-2 type transport system ATP-binding protein
MVELPAHDPQEIEQHLAALRQAGVSVEELEIRKADLEDVFITLMNAPSCPAGVDARGVQA